ncbi:MAG: hypothetical protein SFZ02_21160 [bacterium]|nr:hypothetical protein [bacterium]
MGHWIYNVNEPNIPRHHIKGHDLIASVQFAPHDDIYISYTSRCPMGICEDGQRAYIHDAQTHEILHEIWMSHISAYFIRDGEYLALSSYSHGIVIWRTDSFKENIGRDASEFYQCQIRTQAPVSYVQFSDDKTWLIVRYGDNGTKIVDIATQTVIYEWDYPVLPTIAPDKSKMAWIKEGYIATVNIETGEELDISYFQNVGNHVHWSDSDNTMVTYTQAGDDYPFSYYYDASDEPIFIVWTLTDNGFEYRWSKQDDYVEFVHVGDDYIILTNGGPVEFWDTQRGHLVALISADDCHPSNIFCERWLAVRPDEASYIITSVQRDGAVFTFEHPNLPEGGQSYTIPDHIIAQLDEPDNQPVTWQLADNGDILAQFGKGVYNVTQDTRMQMGQITSLATCRTPANCSSFLIENTRLSRDGTRLFGSGWAAHYQFLDHTQTVLTAWDVVSGKRLYNVIGDTYDDIDLSDDEAYVFLYGNEFYYGMGKTYYNRYAEIYDARTGDMLKFVDTYGGNAYDIDVSPNRRFIVVHSDNNRIWAVVESDEG